jgi:hypothetical protein
MRSSTDVRAERRPTVTTSRTTGTITVRLVPYDPNLPRRHRPDPDTTGVLR